MSDATSTPVNTGLPTSTPATPPPVSTNSTPVQSSGPIAQSTPTTPSSNSVPVSSPRIPVSPSSTPPTSSESSSVASSSSPSSSSIPSSTPPLTSSTSVVSSSPPSTTPPPASSSTQTITPPNSNDPTITQVVTSFQSTPSVTPTSASSSASSTAQAAGSLSTGSKSANSGLGTGGTIAVAVVVPIVAVALLVLLGLWLWKKRKQRKDAEELRRKEVEEYGYNPNNDPTLPAVGAAGSDGPFEMREDGSAGYRGWGTTAVASSGRKASTTISGGQSAGGIGVAYSEGTSPTHAPLSDSRSDNQLMGDRPISGEEALGAMGPAASGNRSDINRGPSNASSSYSAANRSDGSGDVPGGAGYYNNQYETGNPYAETQYGSPPQGRTEMSGQPIIRDVQARRNTRIENPSHFPQQSTGISQNF